MTIPYKVKNVFKSVFVLSIVLSAVLCLSPIGLASSDTSLALPATGFPVTLSDGTVLYVPSELSGTDFFVVAPDMASEYTPYYIYQFDDIAGVDFGSTCNYTFWQTQLNSSGLFSYNGIICSDPYVALDWYYINGTFIYQFPDGDIFALYYRSTENHVTRLVDVDGIMYPGIRIYAAKKAKYVDGEWTELQSYGSKYYNFSFPIMPSAIWTNYEFVPGGSAEGVLPDYISTWTIPVSEPRKALLEWVRVSSGNAVLSEQGDIVYSTFDIGSVPDDDTEPEQTTPPESGNGSSFFEKLGQFFKNLAIPTEVMKVFDAFADIWNTIPVVLRYAIMAMFSTACLFAILKMLF